MTGSWKRLFLPLALLVGGLAGCDHTPPVVDGCHAACTCLTFLDTERAECEQSCQTAAADPNNNVLGDCLQCAADSDTCNDFQRDCGALCGVSNSSFN
jgi:hypothetical protein